MSVSSPPLAGTLARLRIVADARDGHARLSGLWGLLVLSLLARLFGRPQAVRLLPPALPGVAPAGIVMPPCGRAPHAAAIERGLVPDWLLRFFPGLGLRPAAAPCVCRLRTCAVRAPPAIAGPIGAKPPPAGGRRSTPSIVTI